MFQYKYGVQIHPAMRHYRNMVVHVQVKREH
jgi:hypothetical protein